jgi:hypothetical protein
LYGVTTGYEMVKKEAYRGFYGISETLFPKGTFVCTRQGFKYTNNP